MKRIETIRLIRKKSDDIKAVFILEFLKFIGCIVFDYSIPDSVKQNETLETIYDADIVLNLSQKEMMAELADARLDVWSERKETSKILYLTDLSPIDSGMMDGDENWYQLLQTVIKGIWDDEKTISELSYLNFSYSTNSLFYFLYNEGNLKFVQEFYPLDGKKRDTEENRRQAYKTSLQRFGKCYNMLIKYQRSNPGVSEYFRFAQLLLQYKLNEMESLLKHGNLFSVESMLKNVENVKEINPDFIRINYLAGSICKTDAKYWWKAENYYLQAIKNMVEKYSKLEASHFLYYQLGRFYEKKLNKKNLAQKWYEKSYDICKQDYRAFYKIIQGKVMIEAWDEVIQLCNELIAALMNGYLIPEVMPKQRIYAYKCFVMLGDVYYTKRFYVAALQCYDRALKIASEESMFYDLLKKQEYDCFGKIFTDCTPVQPVYFKLINCASKGDNRDLVDQYFEKLYKNK